MIRLTEQYVWNFLFGVLFVSLFVFAMGVLEERAYLDRYSLTLLDIALVTLASFRMTRLFTYDSMTKLIREQFLNVVVDADGTVRLVKPAAGPRRTLADLISCPWCFGIWSASTVAFFYLLTPLAYFPTLALAVAGVASFIQIVANLVGWKAEQIKQEVEG